MTTILTMLVAIGAVFLIVSIWVFVDQWARRTLGERSRCCHSFEKEGAVGCCGKHHQDECDFDNTVDRPKECPYKKA